MIRRGLPLVLGLTLLGASAPAVGAQTTSPSQPVAVVQQLADAFNRNDHAAAIGLFTPGAIVVGGPCGDTQGGECVGQSQIAETVNSNNDPIHVTLTDVNVVGDGNVVTFKTNEAFEFPPQATAAGIDRMVETGTAVIANGKIDRLALVLDVTDPQTVMLQHIWATLEPPSSAPTGGSTPSDGQTLAMQAAATQASFRAAYGDQAATQWATQHQAALNH
jgi:ketosteroid isomerase-like protein